MTASSVASSGASSQPRAVQPEHLPTSGEPSAFLICGLGSLGQYCVMGLQEFGVRICAVDLVQPTDLEYDDLLTHLDRFWQGDCRRTAFLEKIHIRDYRAVLLVTSNDRVNIEAAFAVRSLNPHTRLVVRSARQSLNGLLHTQLGNFVAFDANQLSTNAFAVAALGTENQGFIDLGDHILRVVRHTLPANHRWSNRRQLQELNTSMQRLLTCVPPGEKAPGEFFIWEPERLVKSGDTLTYVELTGGLTQTALEANWHRMASPAAASKQGSSWVQAVRDRLSPRQWRQHLWQFWRTAEPQQTRRVALVIGLVLSTLLLIGAAILNRTLQGTTFGEAIYMSAMLLLDSYDALLDIVGDREIVPVWMQLMHLCFALVGTASVGVIYALLTETLLVAKFQLPKKRPPAPQQSHIVLVGLGRVGRQVASFLETIKQPLVAINSQPLEPTVLPQMPLVVGDATQALAKVNLEQAKGLVICTDDEIDNLEIAMTAHLVNPDLTVVIRTYDPRFSKNVDQVMPFAKALCVYELAAEAFVAAAFGENVLTLLRLDNQTIVVTEYRVEAGDTLNGLLLADVAYGYGVVPLLHTAAQGRDRLMPSDDVRLHEGDRLVVLANSHSLQRIERNERLAQTWWVRIDHANTQDASFAGATAIARVTGCPIQLARDTMEQLPTLLPKSLYCHQALRLVRELGKAGVVAHLDSKT
ncbi:MAG: NAD-binding protein [Kaiparowitsia implicata GSE-PSE-MK54-09C]|nr:NAD-binding protein [Kaiparowitsia implicata GSE-PSE-MK54-09C]